MSAHLTQHAHNYQAQNQHKPGFGIRGMRSRTRTPPHTPKVSKACDKPHIIICKKENEVCGILHTSK